MSLKPETLFPVPEEMPRIAHAAFRKGNCQWRLYNGSVSLSVIEG